MSLDPELLRVDFLGVTVRHEPVELAREALAQFFATAGTRHGLTRCDLHPDEGATLSGSDGAELVLRPGQTASCGLTTLGFHEGLERVAGLLGEALACFGAEPLWIEDVTLIAGWDCGDEATARAALADGTQVDDDRLALLGGDTLSVGLRLWRRGEGATLECTLEPMHDDPTRLYLRLVHSQEEPVPDAAALGEVLRGVHAFLRGPLSLFLGARAPR